MVIGLLDTLYTTSRTPHRRPSLTPLPPLDMSEDAQQGIKRDLETAALEEAEMNMNASTSGEVQVEGEAGQAPAAAFIDASAEEAAAAAESAKIIALTEPGPSNPARPPKKSRYEGKHTHYRSRDPAEAKHGRPKGGVGADGGATEADREPKRPKKKCAVLLGFSGAGYSGMQMWVPQDQLRTPGPALKPPLPLIAARRTRTSPRPRRSSRRCSTRSPRWAPSPRRTRTTIARSTSRVLRGQTRACRRRAMCASRLAYQRWDDHLLMRLAATGCRSR